MVTGDEEKDLAGRGDQPKLVPISGPGLGDLHTVGVNEDVSHIVISELEED